MFKAAGLKAAYHFLQEMLCLLLFPTIVSYHLIQHSQVVYGLKIPTSTKFYHSSVIYTKLLWNPEVVSCPVADLSFLNTITMWHD